MFSWLLWLTGVGSNPLMDGSLCIKISKSCLWCVFVVEVPITAVPVIAALSSGIIGAIVTVTIIILVVFGVIIFCLCRKVRRNMVSTHCNIILFNRRCRHEKIIHDQHLYIRIKMITFLCWIMFLIRSGASDLSKICFQTLSFFTLE